MDKKFIKQEFEKIPVSDKLDDTINNCLEQLKEEKLVQKRRRRRKIFISFATAAAVFSAALILGVSNPDAAGKIPLLGHIFEQIENEVSYKGNYSEHAEHLLSDEEIKQSESGENVNSQYIQKSNGITISVSELYHDYVAIYMTVQIYNEEEFPENIVSDINNQEHGRIELVSEVSFDFYDPPISLPSYIEGDFINTHTYIGIVRIPLHNLPEPVLDQKTLSSAGLDFVQSCPGDYSGETLRYIRETFPDIGKGVEVPENFTFRWNIHTIYDWSIMLWEYANEHHETDLDMLIPQYGYSGNWNFDFNVKLDSSQCDIININESNSRGEGIEKIIKTPYEITADIIMPDTKAVSDYYLIFCDAKGDPLSQQGDFDDSYNIADRDISTVSVFLCDRVFQLGLKDYVASADYKEKRKTKTYAEFLQENALYSTVIHF